MKKTAAVIVISSIVFISCNNILGYIPVDFVDQHRSVIEGVWELDRVEFADSTQNRYTDEGREIKHIGSSHFSTIWQDTENTIEFRMAGFNGGNFTYRDGIYSETYAFFSVPSLIGNTSHWRVDIEDDILSITRITKDGEDWDPFYTQIWQRVE